MEIEIGGLWGHRFDGISVPWNYKMLRASVAVLATRIVVSILPAGATVLLTDLGAAFVLVDLLAGLVSDFFDTAMVVYLTLNF
jgi:hypothetical protein